MDLLQPNDIPSKSFAAETKRAGLKSHSQAPEKVKVNSPHSNLPHSRREYRLRDRLIRFFHPDKIHHQLYPVPTLDFSIRSYRNKDRTKLIEIYNKNAPDRFPENHLPHFEEYLDSPPSSLFVAETNVGEVVACGGVISNEFIHTLCYGLVQPSHQGKGVGSTLTLARMVYATGPHNINACQIYCVPKSLNFYRRFGFVEEKQVWKGSDGRDYPIATLLYLRQSMKSVAKVLKIRGHLIDSRQ